MQKKRIGIQKKSIIDDYLDIIYDEVEDCGRENYKDFR